MNTDYSRWHSNEALTMGFSRLPWWLSDKRIHLQCKTQVQSLGWEDPPLALLVVMLPKAHLTSHSRMSGSR